MKTNSTAHRLREQIFDRYAQNLTHVKELYGLKLTVEGENGEKKEVHEPMYICPLCLFGYSKAALDQTSPNPLTLEDVPPKSVGGRPILLTCKHCNNQAGRKHDEKILDFLKGASFIKREPNIAVKAFVRFPNGLKIKAEVKHTPKNKMVFNLKYPSSMYVDEKLKAFFSKEGEKTINFSLQIPTKELICAPLLRIGLLLAFYYLGNRILFEENYRKILNIIKPQTRNTLPFGGIVFLPTKGVAVPGIHILLTPKRIRAYLIVFDVFGAHNSFYRIGFFFPGPGDAGWKQYQALVTINDDLKLTYRNVTTKKFVFEKGFANAYDYLFLKLGG